MGLFSKRQVPFQVTICGIGELGLHCEAGVTHVLSLLDPGSPEPEAFGTFDPHRRLELRFHDQRITAARHPDAPAGRNPGRHR